MKAKILIVDDDARFRELISDFLKNEGLDVIEAKNGQEALDIFFSEKDIRLIILDVMMPIYDGWEVLSEIRKYSDIPVIMLTALGDENNEAYGINKGADDYISKPFSYQVFIARVKNILGKNQKEFEADLEFDGILINQKKQRVTINGQLVELGHKEYRLFLFLIKNCNIVFTRDKLLDEIWGYDFFGDKRTVDTHIKTLRAKLGKRGDIIKTVRGSGYMLEMI